MKLIVCSDSHGRRASLESIFRQHPDAEVLIFLGDGARDWENADLPYGPNCRIIQVAGNCDRGSDKAITSVDNIGAHKFFITHGHWFHVRAGGEYLAMSARDEGCDVALYGHTHCPYQGTILGVHVFNPGAVLNGHYGTIELDGDQITFHNWQLIPGSDASEEITPPSMG